MADFDSGAGQSSISGVQSGATQGLNRSDRNASRRQSGYTRGNNGASSMNSFREASSNVTSTLRQHYNDAVIRVGNFFSYDLGSWTNHWSGYDNEDLT